MTRPTTPRMPAIISASPLQRIRFEAFMTCQVSLLLWNAGDALEACRMDDAEDQLGNRLRPPPLSPRLVHPTGSSNQVGGDLAQVVTSKPGLEDMIVQVPATGVRRTDLHRLEEPSRATTRDAHLRSRDHDFAPHLWMRRTVVVIGPGLREGMAPGLTRGQKRRTELASRVARDGVSRRVRVDPRNGAARRHREIPRGEGHSR